MEVDDLLGLGVFGLHSSCSSEWHMVVLANTLAQGYGRIAKMLKPTNSRWWVGWCRIYATTSCHTHPQITHRWLFGGVQPMRNEYVTWYIMRDINFSRNILRRYESNDVPRRDVLQLQCWRCGIGKLLLTDRLCCSKTSQCRSRHFIGAVIGDEDHEVGHGNYDSFDGLFFSSKGVQHSHILKTPHMT